MRFAGTQLTNFIDPTNFDAIGKSSIMGNSVMNQAAMKGEGLVDLTEIKSAAEIEAAKFGASATRAQGAAQGQASMFSGLGSMASGIAGGFGTLGNKTPAPVPQPTALEAFDAGTFFAQDYLNR